MIVPQYWAEGRAQHKERGRQITARRFGWSDTSQAEAQSMADQRAQEALRRLMSGEKLLRQEPKIPYNGAQGVPIREEILSRHGDVIITRNSYGAHCLNTPNVLFADIDFPIPSGCAPYWWLLAASVAVALGVRLGIHSNGLALLLLVFMFFGGCFIVGKFEKPGIPTEPKKDAEQNARDRIIAFASSHPDWHLRIYRTPAGFRVVAMHRTFSPDEPAVAEFFKALGTDRVYVRMCRNQNCFRARISPKPWRIGIGQHMRPNPTWPIPPEKLAHRQEWIEKYEAAAANFASCKFIESLGSSTVDSRAQFVQELHDQESRATSDLRMG